MSLPLTDRANEIIEEALNFGTISFANGKMTQLKPDTVLNLAKAICTQKNLKVSEEANEASLPEDMSFDSDAITPRFTLRSPEEIDFLKDLEPEDDKADLTQLSFPFMKHEGK